MVDSGSQNDSVAIARTHPLAPRVAESPRGRASQLNTASAPPQETVFCFLHADTRLPDSAWQLFGEALSDPEVAGGDFRLRFDGDDRFCRLLGAVRAAKRRFGAYYGDPATFCGRWVFDVLGAMLRCRSWRTTTSSGV